MTRGGETSHCDAKVPAQPPLHHARNGVDVRRWNSIGALSCKREASVAATRRLCHLCRQSGESQRTGLAPHGSDCHPALLDLPTKSVLVVGINRWDFDLFSLKRRSSSDLVCSLGLRMLEIHNLFDLLHLDYLTVARTLAAIESVYWHHNPYHTALHAADVAQAIHCFVSLPKLRELLTPAEILGSILAAMCHDADHPGANQLYLERTGHPLVKLYHNNSVLEQHHARVALTILHQSGLAACLAANHWGTVRECIVSMVHATDMAHQAYYRAKFMKLVTTKRDHPASAYTQADRILLLQMSLKCADVSNPCRPWEACREWAYRICEEFFCQGDRERLQWSLTPSKGFDRAGSSVPAIQLAFIDSCIRPLFTSWHEFFQSKFTHRLLHSLDTNYACWKQLAAAERTISVELRIPESACHSCTHSEPKSAKKRFLFGWSPNTKKIYHSSAHRAAVPFRLSQCPHLGSRVASTVPGGEGPAQQADSMQTFFITTTGLRRHSLPETQGAIKKTFAFSRSRRPNISNVAGDHLSSCSAERKVFGPTVHCVYLTSTSFRSLRSGPRNILQTLCEEIINQEPSPRKLHRAFEQDPFPLPDAWNPGTLGLTAEAHRSPYMTKLAIDFSASDFLAFAQRRSSVPLIDR